MKKGVADVSAVCTMNNQRPNPPRKNIKLADLVLFAVAIFLIFMTPWGNTNSYHRLMLFLYVVCVLLRFSNIRKQKMREFEHKRKMEERAAMQKAAERNWLLCTERQKTNLVTVQLSTFTVSQVNKRQASRS